MLTTVLFKFTPLSPDVVHIVLNYRYPGLEWFRDNVLRDLKTATQSLVSDPPDINFDVDSHDAYSVRRWGLNQWIWHPIQMFEYPRIYMDLESEHISEGHPFSASDYGVDTQITAAKLGESDREEAAELDLTRYHKRKRDRDKQESNKRLRLTVVDTDVDMSSTTS